MEDDRIETTRNRVFVRELAFGKDSPIAMKTNDNFVYRVTGMDQVEDIITSGYARSKDKVKGVIIMNYFGLEVEINYFTTIKGQY